jgi:hypothetical protein
MIAVNAIAPQPLPFFSLEKGKIKAIIKAIPIIQVEDLVKKPSITKNTSSIIVIILVHIL